MKPAPTAQPMAPQPTSERTPLLSHLSTALAVPGMLTQPGVEELHKPTTVDPNTVFPEPAFTHARLDARKRRLPQCIAHRGYKAQYPENTLLAFEQAVAAGAHALETDVHVTKDEVVVLSHDATLQRCFGRAEKIVDQEWKSLQEARTIAEPHVPMPRLRDLLDYLAQPGLEEVWVLLDIKLDNNAEQVMRLLGSTLDSAAPPTSGKPWKERVVLGIWAAKFLPLAQRFLPGYSVMHIGFSTRYARHFFSVPHIGFNMLLPVLVGPGGKRFLREAREVHHRRVLAWTVNTEDRMEWCIRRQLDGVITDDPRAFLEVCARFDPEVPEPWFPLAWKGYLDIWRIWVWITVAVWIFRRRLLPVASRELISRQPPAE